MNFENKKELIELVQKVKAWFITFKDMCKICFKTCLNLQKLEVSDDCLYLC